MEFRVDAVEVGVDGPGADAQVRRDFLIAHPSGQHLEYLGLPRAEPLVPVVARSLDPVQADASRGSGTRKATLVPRPG
ncbi:MAG TPA: hypothetical protein P5534_01305 [Candidatus Paceibacterota bacterium]|nr:hypothetical protein [Candidatus Paceibacterota bacterium]HRZ54253.1 hypothetical protein [Candidatus Paceibacterota bacterium]